MSDDEADPELVELLRQHIQGRLRVSDEPETGVLQDAEYVYDNSIDVAVDMRSTKNAATAIYDAMQKKSYSTATWSEHELHPKPDGGEATVAFIFTMDLLNFSFWSELPDDKRFAIDYRGKKWTGYWSLVAALQRALEEGKSFPSLVLGFVRFCRPCGARKMCNPLLRTLRPVQTPVVDNIAIQIRDSHHEFRFLAKRG